MSHRLHVAGLLGVAGFVASSFAVGAASAAVADCSPFGGTISSITASAADANGDRELTEYLPDSGYRVTKCARDGSSPVTTEVHAFATTTRQVVYRPTVETVRVTPGIWRTTRVDHALDARGLLNLPASVTPAPAPTDVSMLSLPPTPSIPTLAARRVRVRAAVTDDSCTNGAYAWKYGEWRGRNANWESRMSTFPAGATTLNRITDGFNAWEDTVNNCGFGDQANINTAYYGDYEIGFHSYPNNSNDVDFGSVSVLPGICSQSTTIACAPTYKDVNNWILETDLRFNSALTWVHSGQSYGYDVRAVATHEAGHFAIDLDDLYCSCNEWMTMYGHTVPGSVRQATLARGDVLGLRAAYP